MRYFKIFGSLAVLFVFLFLACETPLDSSNTGHSYAPPAWIQGEWSDSYDINTYTFSSDNVIFSTQSSTVNFKSTYSSAEVTETSDSDSYEIHIVASGTDARYTFEKLTGTTLNYSITNNGTTVGPIVLTKQ